MAPEPSITITSPEPGQHRLECELTLPRPVDDVFPFFADARNLEAITPKALRFEVLTPEPIEMTPGVLIDYRLRLRGVPFGWRTRIPVWEPPGRFVDEQIRGPYALWRHEHVFTPAEAGGSTRVLDRVDYRLPMGVLGACAHRLFVRRELRSIFAYRSRRLVELFPPTA